MALEAGTKAPDFILPSTSGIFQLSKHAKKESCILYFYPKDFTSGCTKEACDFRDQFKYFLNLKIRILGISTDTVQTHQRFKKKYQLPFELLADTRGLASAKYEAKMPLFNITKRITYLLDEQHIIKGVYSNFFDGSAHVREMKEAISNLLAY